MYLNDILIKEAVIRVQKAINDFDKNLKIQILNETARTASDAAKALNCNVGAIVKSLLLKTDHEFVLCLVSGDKKCSLNKVKKLTGKKDVCMANAEDVKLVGEDLTSELLGFAFPEGSPLVDVINEGLAAMTESRIPASSSMALALMLNSARSPESSRMPII